MTRAAQITAGTSRACPTCGGALAPLAGLHVDLLNNVLTANGTAVRAPPRVVELVSVLHDANGMVVDRERIIARIWAGADLGSVDNTLKTVACHARAVLRPLGWTIRVEYNKGYRLEKIKP